MSGLPDLVAQSHPSFFVPLLAALAYLIVGWSFASDIPRRIILCAGPMVSVAVAVFVARSHRRIGSVEAILESGNLILGVLIWSAVLSIPMALAWLGMRLFPKFGPAGIGVALAITIVGLLVGVGNMLFILLLSLE